MPSNGPGIASIGETIVALGFACNGYYCGFHPCHDDVSGQKPQHVC